MAAIKPLILLTNDDGYFSEGLRALAAPLEELADVCVVAPDREKSATSLSLTLRRPLRVQRVKRNVFSVDGTPADCIYLALKKLLPRNPNLIVSGLNCGPNLGQQDVSYSGTVAAALQGTFLQIPSIAASVLPGKRGAFEFGPAAAFISRTVQRLLRRKLPAGVTLNINIPPPPVKGIRLTKLGQKRYSPEIVEKKDPRRNSYYWIGPGRPKPLGDEETDVRAVELGYISVTPLHTDLTDYRALAVPSLRKLFHDLA